MEIKVHTDLSSEPVTLAVVKNRLKATYGTDATEDAEITSMIKAAREMIERYCDLSLGEKTIEVFFHSDEIAAKRARLPAGPHGTIEYVKRVNQQGTATTLTLNSDYYKRGLDFYELEFLSASVNPWSEDSALADDYKVKLTAGYGIADETDDLPEVFKQAIELQVLRWYHFQTDLGELWPEVRKLIGAYRRKMYI